MWLPVSDCSSASRGLFLRRLFWLSDHRNLEGHFWLITAYVTEDALLTCWKANSGTTQRGGERVSAVSDLALTKKAFQTITKLVTGPTNSSCASRDETGV